MKLLAFVHKAPPEHNAGAEWMLLTIGRELVRRGHEFTIYSRGNVRGAEIDGVKIVSRMPAHKVDRLFDAADVIVTHLDETRGAILRARGKPVVHLVHNDRQVAYHGVRPEEAALLVVNSRWIEETLADWPGPMLVVRPPVYAADYDVEHVERRVTLLNLSEAKGGPLLFELARRMPDVDFLAVRGAYAAQEIPREIPANVELVENTPRVVDDVYARTGILLVPSSYESWGRVAIEAASSGIPVLAHPTPGLLESLGSAGIFLDRYNPDAWEHTIRELLEDPDLYADRSARARERALELDPTPDLDELDRALRNLGELGRRSAVDFAAHTVAYVEHLAPVFLALEPELRGRFFVSSWAFDRALEEGIPEDALRIEDGETLPPGGLIVVASYFDFRRSGTRDVVLAEHGAGQTYGNRHTSYAGGAGRDRAVLFLCPNEQVATRNRKHYPQTRTAIVGSPRVERLLELEREPGTRAVAISFHWRCEVAPEAGTAFDFYRPVLAELRGKLEAEGIELLGHAHPGIAPELGPIYDELGIEFVPSFADVVRRADAYVVDNSSTLFEFAALGRPVVVLNAPQYRRDRNFGLRFWTEADVGLNVDHPDELLETILAALEDPPEVAALREAAVARTYPVTDGAARRAAAAIEDLVRGCPVCGAAHAACGGPTTVVPIDERVRSLETVGTLKRYPNPVRPGAFLVLNDSDAERLGLLGTGQDHRTATAPAPDPTNEGGELLVSSTTAAAETTDATATADDDDPDRPAGALKKGGPTQRARAAAAAEPSPDDADDDEGDDDEGLEPGDKKRPAPSSARRRRKA